MINTSNYTLHNHIQIKHISSDYAEGYVDIQDISLNQMGYVHGGLYFSLADSVAGAASWSKGEPHVTLNATIDYMRPVQSGRLRAVGKVVSRSAKICVVNIEMFDDKDQLVNQGTYTMYNVSDQK